MLSCITNGRAGYVGALPEEEGEGEQGKCRSDRVWQCSRERQEGRLGGWCGCCIAGAVAAGGAGGSAAATAVAATVLGYRNRGV